MDFFSKLGKKASQTYQITKEKATTLTEELKIKGKISEAKDKIEDLYKEIGKKVFEEVKNGRDVIREEISEKTDQIMKLQEQIEKSEIEILALKKIKKCENCGTELELKAEFCSKCGKQQTKIETENIHISEENHEAQEAEVIEVKDIEENKEEE